MAWSFVAPHIAPTPMPHLDGPEMMMEPRAFGFCFGDSWCELDLVTLNGDLGEYFGTKEGILVVKAPADSSLPLRAGDVILSIAGRKPTSPAHAMRILRSYEAGETVSIELMRKQKRLTVAWKVPEPEARHMRRSRGHEEQSHYRGVVRGARTPLGARWVQRGGLAASPGGPGLVEGAELERPGHAGPAGGGEAGPALLARGPTRRGTEAGRAAW